jgi:subtilisin family serine protease
MGGGASPDGVQPTLPAYMISAEDGIALRTTSPSKDGVDGTMGVPFYFLDPTIVNAQTDFTSQGPTDVDFRVKPDLMAPGGNVISSIPVSYCGGDPCFAFLSGTSMASPHLAGTAAVVRAAHPNWTAEQVRSAITNTAVQGVVDASGKPGTVETDVNIVGAGLADVDAALGAKAAIGPVSTSFGAVPSISGQVRSANVTITNLSGASGSWAIAIVDPDGPGGVTFTVNSANVDLSAGQSKTVVVTMTAAKGAKLGDHQAFLNVSAGSTLLAHAAVYAFVK